MPRSVFCGGVAAAARRALSGVQRDVAIALAVAMAVWLANGVFDNQLADKYLYVIPGLLVAVSRASRTASVKPLSEGDERPRLEGIGEGFGVPARAAPATIT